MLSNNWNIFELNCFRIIEYVLDVDDDVQILVVNGFGVCFYFYGSRILGVRQEGVLQNVFIMVLVFINLDNLKFVI